MQSQLCTVPTGDHIHWIIFDGLGKFLENKQVTVDGGCITFSINKPFTGILNVR